MFASWQFPHTGLLTLLYFCSAGVSNVCHYFQLIDSKYLLCLHSHLSQLAEICQVFVTSIVLRSARAQNIQAHHFLYLCSQS